MQWRPVLERLRLGRKNRNARVQTLRWRVHSLVHQPVAARDRLQIGASEVERATLAGLRALVVDDNDVNRRIFEGQVSAWGMVPTSVSSGYDALRLLEQASQGHQPFSLVLLDANMPEIYGFEVARRIAQNPDLVGATVMLLTSSGEYGDVARCREVLGAA